MVICILNKLLKENHQKYWNINILTSTKICQIIRSNIHWMNAGKMIIKSYYMICILVIHQYHRLYIGYIIGYYNIHNNNKMQPMRQSYDRHWFTHTHNQNMNDVNWSGSQAPCSNLCAVILRPSMKAQVGTSFSFKPRQRQPILGKRLG